MAAPVAPEKVVYLLDPVGASRRSAVLRAGRPHRPRARPRIASHGVELPYTPAFLHKHGGLVMSLGQFMQYVGARTDGLRHGADLAGNAGRPTRSSRDERVRGVRLRDQGVDREGSPEAGFMPGMDVHAALTVVGDGPVGAVGRQLDQRIRAAARAITSANGPWA